MDQHLEPLTITVNEEVRVSGRSRSEIYRNLAAGKIKAKKDGKRTLIIFEVAQAVYCEFAGCDLPPPEADSARGGCSMSIKSDLSVDEADDILDGLEVDDPVSHAKPPHRVPDVARVR